MTVGVTVGVMVTGAVKDYNLLARAVACVWCGAQKGEPCRRGPRHEAGTPIKSTHCCRRALAAKLRKALG